ncbi:MAG TPA: PEP-CTERM sorting domain-containing protein [Stellaceae bacterium]|nr:PEP-CTERM sorting domain-containing protein [Stellaceae bacterium]
MIDTALKVMMVLATALLATPAFAGVDGVVPHIPEPASVGLFVTGAAAVIYLRQRLRK